MSLPKIQAVLYTSKTYNDGTHPIMIRLTQNRKRSYTATGYSVLPQAWDEDTHRVYEKKPHITKGQEGQLNSQKLSELKLRYAHAIVLSNATHINTAIDDKINEISALGNKLKANNESLEVKHIKARLKPDKTSDRSKSFLRYAEAFRDKFLKAGSTGTYKRYKTILTKLNEYLKNKDFLFADFTIEFLEDYQAHLKGLGNKINTIHNNLKSIRAIYYSAVAERIITADNNPFFVFKLKVDNNIKKEKLTLEEIIALERLDFKAGSLEYHARNFFLFSFYCAGIRASDTLQLKWGNITKVGRVEYHMDKTGQYKSISLIPKAKDILALYKPKSANAADFIFPYIDASADVTNPTVLHNQISKGTALVNKYLKKVAEAAGIEKKLSTHIARHSFSDIARKRKASIYDISKMLGHSSIKVTEAYLSSFDIDSQDEAIKNVLDY